MALYHPTKQALIDTVVRLLDEKSPDHISSDEVLVASGISRGSLYHHFEDFPELIAAAQVARFSDYVDQSIAALTETLLAAQSAATIRPALERITEATQHQERAPVRFERASALAHAAANPKMMAMLGAEQSRLTEALTDLVREAQHRGIFSSDLDARAVAVLIQAYTLGRVVDDVVSDKMNPEAWNALIMRLVDRVFLAD